MPTVSIVLPCFNAARTLVDTLNSIQAQSLTDWELLAVDDGSTDGTQWILARAAAFDPRIRPIRNTGKGPSAARNLGVAEARSDLIAFCDSDDLWTRDKLAWSVGALCHADLHAAFGGVGFFDGTRTTAQSTIPEGALTVPMLLGENPVCTMSNLVVRRAAFLASGGFDSEMVHNEDLEWLIRFTATGYRTAGIDAELVLYRTSVTGLSSDLEAMRRGRETALATAARFGFVPDARSEAIHLRYLARRALRIGAPGTEAFRFATIGLLTSPAGFLSDVRRGGLTAIAALTAPLMPACLRRALFCH